MGPCMHALSCRKSPPMNSRFTSVRLSSPSVEERETTILSLFLYTYGSCKNDVKYMDAEELAF